jgi:hypothetical protein
MKFYQVIRLDKSGKRRRETNSNESREAMKVRHEVKLLKPRKLLKKLWSFWL